MSWVAVLGVVALLCAYRSSAEVPRSVYDGALLGDLLSNYNSDVKADDHPDGQVVVSLGMTATHLRTKVHTEGSDFANINVGAFVFISWTDHRLAWNKDKYNVDSIAIPLSKIWYPDIMYFPSGGGESLFGSGNILDLRAVVDSSGGVMYIPPVLLHAFCEKTEREADHFDCNMKFGPWAYGSGAINMTAGSFKNDILKDIDPHFKLIDGTVSSHEVEYPCCTDVTVTLHLEDKHAAAAAGN